VQKIAEGVGKGWRGGEAVVWPRKMESRNGDDRWVLAVVPRLFRGAGCQRRLPGYDWWEAVGARVITKMRWPCSSSLICRCSTRVQRFEP